MTTREKVDAEIVEFETDSDISKRKLSVKNIVKAILVRVILMTHSFVTVWRTTDVLGSNYYWFLALANILLVIDGLYTVIRLKGQERKW
jgi:hypothetical protein